MKTVIDKIRELNQGSPGIEAIRKWKAAGGRVVGWACSWNYIPEELIWAAGMLPVRVIGDGDEPQLEQADNYLHADSCSFSRSCFERSLLGQFDFLDGFVASSSCDGIRRLADVWKTYISVPLVYMVDVPWKLTDRAGKFYFNEVVELKERLERHFNVKITMDALKSSIELYNRTRVLLRELNELRKAGNPAISGSEMFEVLNLATKMPRPEFNSVLEELLKERKALKSAQGKPHPDSMRLMLNGSILTNPDFVRALEGLGATVVADSLGNGAGYWWGEVEPDSPSPEAALASYYFDKFPDPRSYPSEKRFEIITRIARDFRADGVISQVIRFCAPLLFDQARLRTRLKEWDIPSLELDVEYGASLIGGAKTRVEAFLEMVREKKDKMR